MSKQHRGLFITLEGGEGAGKSSLVAQLTKFLSDKGFEVVKTREPGGSELGEHIRQVLLDPRFKGRISSRAELFLFLASRAQHVEELIAPALYEGRVVLCDRFHDSTLAYQGMARGLGFTHIEQFCLFSAEGLMPDLTLYLDVDPIEGLKRTAKAEKREFGELDRLEAEEVGFHELVRRGFLLLSERYPKRIVCLDASLTQQQVQEAAIKAVDKALVRIYSHV